MANPAVFTGNGAVAVSAYSTSNVGVYASSDANAGVAGRSVANVGGFL